MGKRNRFVCESLSMYLPVKMYNVHVGRSTEEEDDILLYIHV